MKIYCPKCSKVIDETEFMQYQGLCVSCSEREQNLIQKNKIIKKVTNEKVIICRGKKNG